MTSRAGYDKTAPRLYTINPDNFTGKRLYNWMGDKYDLRVTNACKELVSSASEKGTPDPEWLAENLLKAASVDLILVCGKVAESTFMRIPENEMSHILFSLGAPKLIYCPHPAARTWNKPALERMQEVIHDSKVWVAACVLKSGQLDVNVLQSIPDHPVIISVEKV